MRPKADVRPLISLHTENCFRNLIKSNHNEIVFTIFWLIYKQMDVSLVPNQPEIGKYNLIWGWFDKISKRFLCVCVPSNCKNCAAGRRTAVRETCVPRRHGALIVGSPETPWISQHYMAPRDFTGAQNCYLIMPWDANIIFLMWYFFQFSVPKLLAGWSCHFPLQGTIIFSRFFYRIFFLPLDRAEQFEGIFTVTWNLHVHAVEGKVGSLPSHQLL